MGRSATGQSPLAATVLAALAMAVPCAPLTAQEETRERSGEVIGQVVDARTGTPLAGAFVSLAGSDRGSFTNREGRFQLTGLDVGPHTIAIQQLGYETLLATVEVAISGASLRILMDPDPILLEGLETVSDRFMQRRRSVAARVIAFGPEDLTNSPHLVRQRLRRLPRDDPPVSVRDQVQQRMRARTRAKRRSQGVRRRDAGPQWLDLPANFRSAQPLHDRGLPRGKSHPGLYPRLHAARRGYAAVSVSAFHAGFLMEGPSPGG